LLPHVNVEDVARSISWLNRAFGFIEHYRYGNPLSGAQMHLGNAWIMLKRADAGRQTPKQLGYGKQSLTVIVEDVAAHFETANSAGAKILEEPHETVYGEFQYAAEDPDGHHWLFSRHARDVSPSDWGATVAQPAVIPPQISPMLAVGDGNAAIEFYRSAFDAQVLWRLDGGGHIVAGLEVHGARFFLAHESPPNGTRAPAAVGFTTVRIELFVNDPVSIHRKALAAGALEHSPVREHEYLTTGPRPIKRMLQGAVVDPFGHLWLIGKFLE
jgi:uncharacterized glyoxalase superfamily protein PhnB